MRQPQLQALLEQLTGALKAPAAGYKDRITSKVGDRVHVLDLTSVTHFVARDKLTYAVVDGRSFPVEYSISDLERRLDPQQFIRIHRAILLNVGWVSELNSRFAGRVSVSLKDAAQTRLEVARDRVRPLREFLG